MLPTTSPNANEKPTTLMPTSMEMRAPYIARESMSRPNSSVPNQCAADGGVKRAGRSIAAGSCGAIHGANTATTTNSVTRSTPNVAKGFIFAARTTRSDFERRVGSGLGLIATVAMLKEFTFSYAFRVFSAQMGQHLEPC